MEKKKAYLILQNGQVFEGYAFGAEEERIGELVFTTGMTGYVETLSDPSYYGQIVMQTFPLIGNYGFIPEDMESDTSHITGYVVREWCDTPSNFRAQGTVDDFLKEKGIPGIYGVDTRAITQTIREAGVMNARIAYEVTPHSTDGLKEFFIKDAVASVSCKEPIVFPAEGEKRYRVTMIDCGAKQNIIHSLRRRGCEVVMVPYNTSAKSILEGRPDGVMLCNGPGNPEENVGLINEIKGLMGRLPLFGICLGHQLLALASGGSTIKLKYGHRGGNQPVRDLLTGRVYITSQNHGYAVDPDSLRHTSAKIRMLNANDNTCEGVDYPDLNAFTMQFHPEACGGPLDMQFLFDRFIGLMGGECHAFE